MRRPAVMRRPPPRLRIALFVADVWDGRRRAIEWFGGSGAVPQGGATARLRLRRQRVGGPGFVLRPAATPPDAPGETGHAQPADVNMVVTCRRTRAAEGNTAHGAGQLIASDLVAKRMMSVLAADVVDYTRLMEVAELETHIRLRALRVGIDRSLYRLHRGQIIKNTGDGFLASFDSTVDAFAVRVEIQREIPAGESSHAARYQDTPAASA